MTSGSQIAAIPEPAGDEVYEHLEWRPHAWRRQPYLKGRSMTVAHLVYTMRAEDLTSAEAAREFELPLAQVQEALLHYRQHHDVVERDQEAERRYLESKGFTIDPPAVPR
ncbi:MAG: hypothetical protein HY332_01420 [Chloroflexi bacterium]|nr:hypothetical protein [Chloroflexota bacterium]